MTTAYLVPAVLAIALTWFAPSVAPVGAQSGDKTATVTLIIEGMT